MSVTEIAADCYRISTYIPEIDLQFNQFLIKDEEPLLFHTGMKVLFPTVREAVETIIDPAKIRWRSEEHTSELQSQSNLVCRLLLEKKKKHIKKSPCPHPQQS